MIALRRDCGTRLVKEVIFVHQCHLTREKKNTPPCPFGLLELLLAGHGY
jgi:hypothetical protein